MEGFWIREELAGCNSTTSFKMVPKMDREVDPELHNIPVAAADHQRIGDDHCGGEMGIATKEEMFEGQTHFGSVPLPDVKKNCQCGSDHGYYSICQVAVLSALSGFCTVKLQSIGH